MLPESFDEFLNGPAVLLGLLRHKERADYSLKKLNDAGFNNVSFISGIDGFVEDLDKVSKELNINILPHILKEKGCAGFTLSCVMLWKKIIDEDLPYLTIFEDDALPHPNFRTVAKDWYDLTPKDLELMYIGSQSDDGTDNKIIQAPCFCTHAYVVTQVGARKLMELAMRDSNDKGVDKGDCAIIQWMHKKQLNWRIWNTKNMKFITPFKVAHSNTEDSIWPHRDNGLIYQNSLLGSSISGLKLVLN